jgi:hypothetical protein
VLSSLSVRLGGIAIVGHESLLVRSSGWPNRLRQSHSARWFGPRRPSSRGGILGSQEHDFQRSVDLPGFVRDLSRSRKKIGSAGSLRSGCEWFGSHLAVVWQLSFWNAESAEKAAEFAVSLSILCAVSLSACSPFPNHPFESASQPEELVSDTGKILSEMNLSRYVVALLSRQKPSYVSFGRTIVACRNETR